MKTKLIVSLVFILMLACGDSEKKDTPEKSIAEKEVTDWARPGAQGKMSGAYFTYRNQLSVADTLISVQSNSAMMTQVHEAYTTDDGLAGMREINQIIIIPKESLVLQKGGIHVMLMSLKEALANGDSITVELNFAQAGVVELKMPVLSSN